MNEYGRSISGMILRGEKPKHWEKNPPQCHFVHHRFNWPGTETGTPQWETVYQPPPHDVSLNYKPHRNV